MKVSELLEVIEAIMKDTAPRSSLYARVLREHMHRRHKEILSEDVVVE